MSFTFNFDVSDDADDDDCLTYKSKKPKLNHDSSVNDEPNSAVERNCTVVETMEFHWPDLMKSVDDWETEMIQVSDGINLKCIWPTSVEEELGERSGQDGSGFRSSADVAAEEMSDNTKLLLAVNSNSDLVTGVYEGGLKIWECALDLAEFLHDNKVQFDKKHVLELGCGAGVPGLLALMSGAHVTFQDYNREVLRLLTARNVLMNSPDSTSDAGFISGPWSQVDSNLLKICPQKFDLILTSETIYSCESYSSLVSVMKSVLAPHGTVYLAAKTYYFGVGGGIRDFEDFLDRDGTFTHCVCKEFTTGVKREILKLTFKSATAHTENHEERPDKTHEADRNS